MATASDSASITIDNTPTITVESPTQDLYYADERPGLMEGYFGFSGTVAFKPAPSQPYDGELEVWVDGSSVGSRKYQGTQNWTCSHVTGHELDAGTFAQGQHTIKAIAVADNGVSQAATTTFNVDNTPTVTVWKPRQVQGSFIIYGTVIFQPVPSKTIDGELDLYIDGTLKGSKQHGTWDWRNSQLWSSRLLTGTDFDARNFTPGQHTIKVVATAYNGAQAEASTTFTISSLEINNFNGSINSVDPTSGDTVKFSADITGDPGEEVSWELDLLSQDPSISSPGVIATGSTRNVVVLWNGIANGTMVKAGDYTAVLTAHETNNPSCKAKNATLPLQVKWDEHCLEITIGSRANLATGNLSQSQALFSTSGTGPAVSLTLYYNSLDPYAGTLGRGWSHSYDEFLTEFADGSVVLREGNGRELLYTLSANGYVSQAGDYAVLQKNADGTFARTEKDGTTSFFDQTGKLTAIEDRNGNTLSFAYTGGLLSTITDAVGRVTTFTYDAAGELAAITDPAGETYKFLVAGNQLMSAIYPGGKEWDYGYDEQGFLTTKTDPSGFTTTYGYDDQHRVKTATDPEGRVRSLAYPALSTDAVKTTYITEKDGSVWRYTYDTTKGDLTEKQDPQGGVTKYVYDDNHNLLAMTDPNGGTSTFTYDQAGNMTSATDPLGQVTTYTYNGYGQVTSVTDAAGNVTVFSYDGRGNLLSVTDPAGGKTSYQYDQAGQVIAVTNPLGETTTIAYDKLGNPVSVTDGTGAVTTLAYDADGRLINRTNPLGRTTTFAYDASGNLIKITDPQGNTTTFTYDADGHRTSMTDADGNTTWYEYNYQGQLTQIKDALGKTTTLTYGGNEGCPSCSASGADKLTALTDANGNTTTFGYDALGRMVTETDAKGNVTQYGYDAKGNVISRTDANGNTIIYTYDQLGRLTGKTFPDGTTASFAYDVKGRLIKAANQDISYDMTYDAAGRLLSITDSNGRTISYKYDAAGNRVKMITPDGKEVDYSYDQDNRLTQIDSWAGTFAFGYDLAGRRTNLSYPNGVATSYTYDPLGNLTKILAQDANGKKSSTLSAFAYTLDNVGNRLTQTALDDHENGTRYEYAYDPDYRLLESLPVKLEGRDMPQANKAEDFTYDPVGNRLVGPKGADIFTHNKDNQLLEGPRYRYKYDKDGNLIGKTGSDEDGDDVSWTYKYDYENRLVKVTKMDADETTVVSFKYDPFGRRIEKQVQDLEDGGTKTYAYVYDNEDIILETLTQTDDGEEHTETTRYLHGPGIDEQLAVEQKGELYFYHADGLGSVTSLTDSASRVVQSYEYSSFGIPKRNGDQVKQPYAFTGREWDAETGLYFYRARYYDPVAGRFISKDPIGFAGGDVNLYGYVQNNPVNLVDPLGLSAGDAIKGLYFGIRATGVLTKEVARMVATDVAVAATSAYLELPFVVDRVLTGASIYGNFVGLGEVGKRVSNEIQSIKNEMYNDQPLNPPPSNSCL